MENGKIFSFDLGTGSLASCVRQADNILYLNVETLPGDFATLKEARERRRQIRTRIAHKQREEWWKKHAQLAGIEVLETGHLDENGNYIKPDPRMSQEFSKKGDPTIYNSLLLRIALLQGEKLEGWQIFKAIWSAIQRRGYDSDIPWKHKIEGSEEEDEEQEENNTKKKRRHRSKNKETEDNKEDDKKKNKEAVENYKKKLKEVFGDNEELHYPSYLEAYTLGIWSPDEPKNFSKTIQDNPNPVRNKGGKINYISPAEMVEKEVKQLLIQVGKQYPYIKNNLNYILYGPSGCKYGAYLVKDYRKFMGKDWEWQGLISQKTPRFDNRIISKCVLIPRLNVCKRKDPLNKEVTFLTELKNFRYVDAETGEEKALTPEELNQMYDTFKDEAKINTSELKKYVESNLSGILHPSFSNIEPPKTKGRSKFCRPALKIIKEILLSGKSPHALYQEYTSQNQNSNTQKGLINEDYAFLLKMPEEWDKFYIPDEREDEAQLNEEQRIQKIIEIINKITNPVVKHRLFLFYKKLEELKQKFGEPNIIMLEFPRNPEEMIAGKKQKEKIKSLQDADKDRKNKAEQKLKELSEEGIKIDGRKALLKLMLWMEQEYKDPYSYENIGQNEIDNCEIDHIVPREKGGPDSYLNVVLTHKKNNQAKGEQTPFEWLGKSPEQWKRHIEYIETFKNMKKRKKKLLTSKNPKELIDKYTNLAGTAYISKLAQKICHLFFGWEQLTKGSTRRVFIASGSFTSKIRSMFKLDKILYPNLSDNEFKKIGESKKLEEKNRSNPRHHALDTIVLSVVPEVKYNPTKEMDEYPSWFHKDFCQKEIEKCFPRKIRFEKPKLAETIYGLRELITPQKTGNKQYVFVTRFGEGTKWENYKDIQKAKKYVDSIYSYNIRKDLKDKLDENPSPEEWEVFLHNYRAGGKPKKILLIASKPFDEEDVHKFLKGEIPNLGEFIKGKMPGQFLKQSQESHGYFIYKDSKGKWQREPIYAFESPYKKKKEILRKDTEIYFFKSGITVKIENDFIYQPKNKEPLNIKKGIYFLNSINETKQCKLKQIDGNILLLQLDPLMELGKMIPV